MKPASRPKARVAEDPCCCGFTTLIYSIIRFKVRHKTHASRRIVAVTQLRLEKDVSNDYWGRPTDPAQNPSGDGTSGQTAQDANLQANPSAAQPAYGQQPYGQPGATPQSQPGGYGQTL